MQMTKGGDVVEVHEDLVEAMTREGWEPTSNSKTKSGGKAGSTNGETK